MNENEFYESVLGLPEEWAVEGAEKDEGARRITVKLGCKAKAHPCPLCGAETVLYGTKERTVRHLDICIYQTFLAIKVPRIRCPEHGVMNLPVSFVDRRGHFTHEFALRVLELCKGATVQKVAKDLGLHWGVIEKIKERAVRRGLARRGRQPPEKVKRLTMDETSFRKHHDYSTIFTDADSGCVLAAIEGRAANTVTEWFATQTVADFSELESISMDMAPPYIKAVRETFPHADQLICYDRFHVAQLFSRAVDAVRRKESAALERRRGENPLARTRFDWLRNNEKADNRTKRRRKFMPLTELPLVTVKAWKLKEMAAKLWGFTREGNAEKAWKRLLWRLSHSRIGELKKLYKSLKEHLGGILNAIRLRATNAAAEARNSCIQRVKYMACGFRNKGRFHREILFQFGGLDFAF